MESAVQFHRAARSRLVTCGVAIKKPKSSCGLVYSSSPLRSMRNYSSSSLASAKVLLTDGIDESCIRALKHRGHEVDLIAPPKEAELCKLVYNSYDALIIRSATKVTKAVIESAAKGKRLVAIGRAGVGVDNIDVVSATKNGILVMNTPEGNTVSTAQLTISLLSSLMRLIPQANMAVKSSESCVDNSQFIGAEMRGKTLGIVGCGKVGQLVATYAAAVGMHILAYDPAMTAELKLPNFKRTMVLDDLWRNSEVITFHVPYSPETANMLNDATLKRCKPGVRIINCARGGIVDEAALLRGLESGQVAGAALDVYTSEPPKIHLKKLLEHPRVVCTPHLGASTEEAQMTVAKDIAEQLSDLFSHLANAGPDEYDFRGVMNVNYLSASSNAHMKPFMKLAENMGKVLGQVSDNPIEAVEIKTWGGRDVPITTKLARQLLEACVLNGILASRVNVHNRVGIISAPQVAKDSGIRSIISMQPPEGYYNSSYWNMLSVEATREDGSSTILRGSVFGSTPHLTQVNEYKDLFSFKFMEGVQHMLIFKCDDRPGVIAQVLDILSQANINVASLNGARLGKELQTSSRHELCLMALDENVPAESFAAIKALEGVFGLANIQL